MGKLAVFRRKEGHTVVFNEGVGNHVEGGGDAEETIEADRLRSIDDRPGVIDIPDLIGAFDGEFGNILAGEDLPIHTEVPFPEAGGRIALLFEQSGEREAARFDQAGRETSEDTAFEPRSP